MGKEVDVFICIEDGRDLWIVEWIFLSHTLIQTCTG